jgi:hypothetical protein
MRAFQAQAFRAFRRPAAARRFGSRHGHRAAIMLMKTLNNMILNRLKMRREILSFLKSIDGCT